VAGEKVADAEAREADAACAGEGGAGADADFGKPSAKDTAGLRPKGDGSLFPPFSAQVQKRRGTEHNVVYVYGNDLGHTCPAVVEGEEQRVITPACALCAVRGGKDGLDLLSSQVAHEPPIDALYGDGKDTGDLGDRFWCGEGGEAEEGPDGGEASISGADGIASLSLEVVEERKDRIRPDIGEGQACRLQSSRAVEEAQQ